MVKRLSCSTKRNATPTSHDRGPILLFSLVETRLFFALCVWPFIHSFIHSNACSISAMISSMVSIPMDKRTIPGVIPHNLCCSSFIWECVVVAGLMASDLAVRTFVNKYRLIKGETCEKQGALVHDRSRRKSPSQSYHLPHWPRAIVV